MTWVALAAHAQLRLARGLAEAREAARPASTPSVSTSRAHAAASRAAVITTTGPLTGDRSR